MAGQDPRVQHVGIGQDAVPSIPQRPAGVLRCVAVVGAGDQRNVGSFLFKAEQPPQLVLRQGFRGKHQERCAFRVFEEPLQDGDGVAERLSRGRAGDDHHVLASSHGVHGISLMGVEAVDAELLEGPGDDRVDGRLRLPGACGPGRQDFHVDDLPLVIRAVLEAFQKPLHVHFGDELPSILRASAETFSYRG